VLIIKAVISSSFNLEGLYSTKLNYTCYLRYFEVLGSAEWQLLTGVSEQPVSSAFSGQTVQDETDGLSRNVGTKLPFDAG